MTKGNLPLKLSTQVTLASLVAVFLAVAVFFACNTLGVHLLQSRLENRDYVEEVINRKVEELSNYVSANSLSTTDIDAIIDWVNRERNVTLVIYDEGRAIFDSTVVWQQSHDNIENGPPPGGYRSLYSVSFADKDVQVEMFVLIEFKVRALIINVSALIAITVFILILTGFIRYKVRYITQLEGEVNILEGGDLSYPLTIRGNDEFTYLARSIDNMRTSIIERQREEEQAREANHKLVTAMSHDLRTPLTVLIGLLEIIEGKKYTSNEELEKYISKSKDKAYQIKELSDSIFEYFFAFDMKENQLEREYYTLEVINTMLEDYIFTLEEKGYRFKYTPCISDARVYIDVKIFGRVFGNVFSNILKYGDREQPVVINSRVEEGYLNMDILNGVKAVGHKEESTNIGIEVCRNILKQHNGEFYCVNRGDTFTVFIKLKVKA